VNLAPIVLFVYNRLWHTKQTIEALQKNEFAKETELFIYADGVKEKVSKDDIKKVEEVRSYIKTITGFKKVVITERNENYGLAENIIFGVTEIINKFGKIIVLEDDIVTSPFFLQYMNNALNFYENESKVMTISAYSYPINSENLPETYLLRPSACWGWATWENSWKFFNNDIDNTIKKFSKKDIYTFDADGTAKFWEQVIANKKGRLKTWAIFWSASMFVQNGLTLFPKFSYTNNIGHDNSGENCDTNNNYDALKISNFAWVCSGTATLETAILGVPMIIIYKTSFITWCLSKLLIKLPNIGLVNIVSGKKIVPELIQYEARPQNIMRITENLVFHNKAGINKIKDELLLVKNKLSSKNANKTSSEIILQIINSEASE